MNTVQIGMCPCMRACRPQHYGGGGGGGLPVHQQAHTVSHGHTFTRAYLCMGIPQHAVAWGLWRPPQRPSTLVLARHMPAACDLRRSDRCIVPATRRRVATRPMKLPKVGRSTSMSAWLHSILDRVSHRLMSGPHGNRWMDDKHASGEISNHGVLTDRGPCRGGCILMPCMVGVWYEPRWDSLGKTREGQGWSFSAPPAARQPVMPVDGRR